MERERICQECIYYMERYDDEDEVHGVCFRFPPIHSLARSKVSDEYVRVTPDMWCGEFAR